MYSQTTCTKLKSTRHNESHVLLLLTMPISAAGFKLYFSGTVSAASYKMRLKHRPVERSDWCCNQVKLKASLNITDVRLHTCPHTLNFTFRFIHNNSALTFWIFQVYVMGLFIIKVFFNICRWELYFHLF